MATYANAPSVSFRPVVFGATVFFSLVLLFVLSFFAPVTIIPAGHVGVKTLFGQVDEKVLTEGLHFVNPFSGIAKVSVQIEKISQKFEGASKDLQAVYSDVTINLRLDPSKVPYIYKNIGMDYVNKIVFPAASEVIKAELALHNVTDILAKRQLVKTNVQKDLTTWLKKYNIDVNEVSLANIKFSEQYEHAVEQKQLEEQKALQKTYELQQSEQQAKIVAMNAKGQADAQIAAATGEAESLKIKGEAQAAYNDKVAKSLTSPLLQQRYYEKWDGKLPTMILGDKANTMIQIPSN